MKFPFSPSRWLIAIVILVAIPTTGWLLWKNFGYSHPLWTKDEGSGAVFSTTSTLLPDGREIIVAGGFYHTPDSDKDLRIVAYAAENGRQIWETRYDVKISNNLGPKPLLMADPHGNIVVTWGYGSTIAQKLDGSTGKVLWEYKEKNEERNWNGEPEAIFDSFNRLWISSIDTQRGPDIYSDTHPRCLTLLDSTTGAVKWRTELNLADYIYDELSRIHALKNGDIVVVSPPKGDHNRHYWAVYLLEGSTGTVKWKMIPEGPGHSEIYGFKWIVDEAHNQLLAAAGGEFISYNLGNGKERWRTNISSDLLKNSEIMWFFSMSTGDILIAGNWRLQGHSINWFNWHFSEGMLFPSTKILNEVQPMQAVLDAASGSLIDESLLEIPTLRFLEMFPKEGSQNHFLLARNDQQWRVVELNREGVFTLHRKLNPPPFWQIDCRTISNDISVTRTGKIIVIKHFPIETQRWYFSVW